MIISTHRHLSKSPRPSSSRGRARWPKRYGEDAECSFIRNLVHQESWSYAAFLQRPVLFLNVPFSAFWMISFIRSIKRSFRISERAVYSVIMTVLVCLFWRRSSPADPNSSASLRQDRARGRTGTCASARIVLTPPSLHPSHPHFPACVFAPEWQCWFQARHEVRLSAVARLRPAAPLRCAPLEPPQTFTNSHQLSDV